MTWFRVGGGKEVLWPGPGGGGGGRWLTIGVAHLPLRN